MSQLSPVDVGKLADASDDPRVKALFADLEQLPEPEREKHPQCLARLPEQGWQHRAFECTGNAGIGAVAR
ncbi:hypothetical protein ACFS4T_15525 [Pseudomonas lini]